MSLQIQYSKQIARQLGKIAVYLPGEEVNVGDIIQFPNGKKGIFKKAVPWGTFKKVTSLQNLNVGYKESSMSESPDPYQFSSKDSVNVEIENNLSVEAKGHILPKINSSFSIKFSAEGAIYFLAIGCNKKGIDDLTKIENQIQSNSKLIWDDTFLVTSVTIAQKALIAQSNSKNSELTLGCDIPVINTKLSKINAHSNLSIIKESGSTFIKDWSDNVTIFMDVIKLEKDLFEVEKSALSKTMKIPKEDTGERILLKEVNIQEYLNY